MTKKTKEEFIRDAKLIHGEKYDYSKVEYINNCTKVCIICLEHGEFYQTPHNHLKGKGCPQCAKAKMLRTKSLEKFILEARDKHSDKYDYSKVKYINSRTKVTIVCPEHGEFEQLPYVHLQGCGCPKCGQEKTGEKHLGNTQEFITKANIIHEDKYNYNKVVYKKAKSRVIIVCPQHGEFFQTPEKHLQGNGCPLCSHHVSNFEKEIAEFLSEYIEIQTSVKNILDNGREIDIYVPSKRIGIEYNGMWWHCEENKDKNYHLNKLKECNSKGIRLIQIFEAEYVNNPTLIKKKLLHILGLGQYKQRIFARNCIIKEIKTKQSKEFLEKNHIQSFVCSSVYLGAYYQDKLVAVMTFKRTNNIWELTRFATDNDIAVVGIGGKLFKYFLYNWKPNMVKSFADLRWTIDVENNLYTKLGFILDSILKPDYHYTRQKHEFWHKFHFRKAKLNKKFGFSMNLTEKQMADQLGYWKIWDCGLAKYIWRPQTK